MQFLLERLAACPTQAVDLKASVAAQIQRIVSARPTEAPSEEISLFQFGMPSIVETNLGSQVLLERYAARLARQIAHYEPRLLQPQVTVQPARGRLTPYQLIVSGMLAPDNDVHTFRFELSDY